VGVQATSTFWTFAFVVLLVKIIDVRDFSTIFENPLSTRKATKTLLPK